MELPFGGLSTLRANIKELTEFNKNWKQMTMQDCLMEIKQKAYNILLKIRLHEFLGNTIGAISKKLLKNQWRQLLLELNDTYSQFKSDFDYIPPETLQILLISAEDHRFFLHPGFDIIAICRAVWRRFAWGVVEGASTIEQQLVRVLTGRYERTLRRKIAEILLATLLTKVVSKRELPALYLYIAYYGWRMNGIKQAC